MLTVKEGGITETATPDGTIGFRAVQWDEETHVTGNPILGRRGQFHAVGAGVVGSHHIEHDVAVGSREMVRVLTGLQLEGDDRDIGIASRVLDGESLQLGRSPGEVHGSDTAPRRPRRETGRCTRDSWRPGCSSSYPACVSATGTGDPGHSPRGCGSRRRRRAGHHPRSTRKGSGNGISAVRAAAKPVDPFSTGPWIGQMRGSSDRHQRLDDVLVAAVLLGQVRRPLAIGSQDQTGSPVENRHSMLPINHRLSDRKQDPAKNVPSPLFCSSGPYFCTVDGDHCEESPGSPGPRTDEM